MTTAPDGNALANACGITNLDVGDGGGGGGDRMRTFMNIQINLWSGDAAAAAASRTATQVKNANIHDALVSGTTTAAMLALRKPVIRLAVYFWCVCGGKWKGRQGRICKATTRYPGASTRARA